MVITIISINFQNYVKKYKVTKILLEIPDIINYSLILKSIKIIVKFCL